VQVSEYYYSVDTTSIMTVFNVLFVVTFLTFGVFSSPIDQELEEIPDIINWLSLQLAYQNVKAKETKKCHHRDDDDFVEFCQL
jgi:hypothetical protein